MKSYPQLLWKTIHGYGSILEKCKIYPPKMWKNLSKFTGYKYLWKTCPPEMWRDRFFNIRKPFSQTYPHLMWISL
jgi:hypothetical protein